MDTACKDKNLQGNNAEFHNIPLFCSDQKSSSTELCNPDIIIIEQNKVKIIIEIEESQITPTHICGKYLTSSLSKYYIYNNKKIEIDNQALFIQIYDTSKLPKNTKKKDQLDTVEKLVENLSIFNKNFEYKIFPVEREYFQNENKGAKEIKQKIEEKLK